MEEKLSTKYNDAVQQIKAAILKSQAKALAGVNQEQLALYYGIGRYISNNSRAGFWGKDAIETISRQLSAEMPGLRGFSPRNLRNMRTFYEQWSALDSNLAVPTAEIGEGKNLAVATAKIDSEKELMAFSATELPLAAFFSIGFTHHIAILTKTKTLEERKFYIQLCHDLHLKVEEIEQKIAEDTFHKQGTLPNNFNQTIPDYKQAFRAIQMFKDEYLLDYINVEQLGERDEDIDERVIEKEIVNNVKNFIMTFGKGFTFSGSQVHYDKLGHDHWVDLLFSTASFVQPWLWNSRKASSSPAIWGSCPIICTSLMTMTVWSGKTHRWASSSARMPTEPSLNTCCRTTSVRWAWPPTRPARINLKNFSLTRRR